MTPAQAKEQIDRDLAEGREPAARRVSAVVCQGGVERTADATMSARRNERGGIDYEISVDPVDIGLVAQGVV